MHEIRDDRHGPLFKIVLIRFVIWELSSVQANVLCMTHCLMLMLTKEGLAPTQYVHDQPPR